MFKNHATHSAHDQNHNWFPQKLTTDSATYLLATGRPTFDQQINCLVLSDINLRHSCLMFHVWKYMI